MDVACSRIFRAECCRASSIEVIKKRNARGAAGGSLQSKTDTVQDNPVSSDVKQKSFPGAFLFLNKHYKTGECADEIAALHERLRVYLNLSLSDPSVSSTTTPST